MQSSDAAFSDSSQNSFDKSLRGEFESIRSAIDIEIDQIPSDLPQLRFPLQTTDVQNGSPKLCQSGIFDTANELIDSDSVETVNPSNVRALPIEDPIVTYDSVVAQMKADGVEWIPPEQMSKRLSEVRLAAPDLFQQNTNLSGRTTTATELAAEITLTNGRQGSSPAQVSDLSNTTSLVHHPNSDTNDSSVSENVSKLRELQLQLNQEKATRKQQEDYIQQLQRYYDNLLAKHAAAEMTIDHLRFRAKVGCDDTAATGPGSQSVGTLRGRKLISTSLDICALNELSKKPHHPPVSSSLNSFRKEPTEVQARGSQDLSKKPSVQPQVHLIPLSSSAGHLNQDLSNSTFIPAKSDPKGAVNGDYNAFSGEDRSDFTEDNHPQSEENSHVATEDAAKSLEDTLSASLTAIHGRLNAIEARLSDDRRNEALTAIHHELEDLRRRYQAGQYLWSGAGLFDNQAVIATRLDSLTQRLQQIVDGRRCVENDGIIPARPSSLNLADSHRPGSAESNSTSTGPTGANSSGSAGFRQEDSSSSNSGHINSLGPSSPANSKISLEVAEAHFTRLLGRYDKLKVVPNHGKDVESLMQRLLQLSDRYSNQSSVIFSPRRLRRIFESDYNINNGANEAVNASSFSPTHTRLIPPKGMLDSCNKPRQMVSPDSGVPQTPLGSSGSSGASCYGTTAPRNSLFRQTSTVTDIGNECPVSSQRKQSDSGFWATDSCSGVAPLPIPKGGLVPSFSSATTTNTDELDADNNIGPSKMLPNEMMSLEADIERLRQGIARLTSTASASSALRYRGRGAASDSSGSTCEEDSPRKNARLPPSGGTKSSTLERSSKRSGYSSANLKQSRLPSTSSSSGEDNPYSTYNRRRYSSRSRHRVVAPNHNSNTLPPLEVVGSGLTPQQRTLNTGPTRTYHRPSSRTHLQTGHIMDANCHRVDTCGSRRSRSTTGPRVYYHPCGSCGGSGYNLNMIGRSGPEEAVESPAHSRTISDPYVMPARVIYEYRQTPTIRLPVQDNHNGWTERVYGMQELYGSAVSPQLGRDYNTIGHQPSTSFMDRSTQNPCSWASGQSILLPATSSPLLPQRVNRRTRHYLPSTSHSLRRNDTASSGSESEICGVTVLPTSRSLHNHRRRSSSQQITEPEDFSSTSSGAYAAARCVTQMAHQLNKKLTRHHDRSHIPIPHSQPRRPSIHRHNSQSYHRDSGDAYVEGL